jgi:hypothetical protein
MPIRITKFPSKEFNELFNASCEEVREYFLGAYEVAARAAEYRAGQEVLAVMKERRKAKTFPLTGLVLEIMAEQNSKRSTVYNAIRCGEAFDTEAVEQVMRLCEESGHLPSRELFIQLLPVPSADRLKFAEEMIKGKAAARSMTLKRIETYDRKSKGTKKPKAPTSLFEAKEQVIKEQNRVNALGEALLSAVAVGKRKSAKTGFVAPPAVAPKIRTARRALASLRRLLEDAIGGDAAA